MEVERVAFEVADGITLVGDACGDVEAPPVLLLTGAGQTRQAWGGTVAAIAAAGLRAVAVDHRGHGDSSWPPGDDAYGLEVFLDDTVVLARMFDRPAVVGASLGGMAALMGIGDRAEIDARALVLVDVAPRLELDGATRIIEFMSAHPDGFSSLDEAADWIASYLPQRGGRRSTAGLEKVLRRDGDRWRWHWDPRFLTGMRQAIYEAPGGAERRIEEMRVRLLSAARRLTIPTLLIRGGLSDIVSEAGAHEFLAAAPHAEYVDVSEAGHMVAGDRNDAFTAAVVTFLRGLAPSARLDPSI
jgi:pimeloyl-ACP methyl ester carboxylesterase